MERCLGGRMSYCADTRGTATSPLASVAACGAPGTPPSALNKAINIMKKMRTNQRVEHRAETGGTPKN